MCRHMICAQLTDIGSRTQNTSRHGARVPRFSVGGHRCTAKIAIAQGANIAR